MGSLEAEIVLVVGLLLLAGGCLSTLVVHLCSPGLKGMAWLSCAFGSGSLAAACFLQIRHIHPLVLPADAAVLSAFLLLYRAVLDLNGDKGRAGWFGFVLIGLQLIADTFWLTGYGTVPSRVISMVCWLP